MVRNVEQCETIFLINKTNWLMAAKMVFQWCNDTISKQLNL